MDYSTLWFERYFYREGLSGWNWGWLSWYLIGSGVGVRLGLLGRGWDWLRNGLV